MQILRIILSATSIGVLFISSVSADAATSEVRTQAEEDIALGMMGLKQAASDPKLLAQLMADMQDPEMMAEAKKMMENPEFKDYMKKMSGSSEFKDSLKKTKEMFDDPSTAARMQAQMEHMVKVGQDQIKKGADETMKEAMESMKDPALMAEAVKMMKDPKFVEQLKELSKDPAFKNYQAAMAGMMGDPEKKREIEAIADAFKSAL